MTELPRRGIAAITGLIVLAMNAYHEQYKRRWWWDNTAHFLSGFALGIIFPDGRERRYYFGIATLWEIFEWRAAKMNILDGHPRSLGHSEWNFDHQAEDTILDTIMGYYGVKLAQRLKREFA